MICLVRDADTQLLLPTIRDYLIHARDNRIPHAWHEFPPDEAAESSAANDIRNEPVAYRDLDQVAGVLFELASQLCSGGHRRYGRIVFRRLDLVQWLMSLRLDPNRLDHDAELAGQIRRFERSRGKRMDPGTGLTLAGSDPWWARLAILAVPPLWFGLRLRLSAKYRWFLRQSFLAPHDPGSFLGFAQRLTGWMGEAENRKAEGEDPAQLLGLLVNAFLEDVRRAYRRRWWRPRAARRTTYVVIVLDRITRRNGGYRLLETVNLIRNDTGLFDPLLFISGSRKVPPDATPPGAAKQRVWEMRESRRAYDHWCGRFAQASRARKPAAWYLPIEGVTAKNEGPEDLPATNTLVVPPSPMWSRATVLIGTVLILALVVAFGVIVLRQGRADAQQHWSDEHCGLGREDFRAKYLVTINGECIGVSAEPLPIFKASSEQVGVQQVIAKQNGEAEQARRETPERKFITVAYISEIGAAEDIVPTEVERLQGIAARQRRQLDGNRADPLVRVLFVNAGREMQHGTAAVRKLAELMEVDRTIVAAVGLAVSSQPTADTIKALGAAGIPVIAAPLTADNLPSQSPLYYQVSPQNRREAQVAAKYVRHELHLTGTVIVVSADNPKDFYGTTLTEDAMEEFGNEGFAVEKRIYTPSPKPGVPDKPTPREIGQRLCGGNGLVFYTGRPADFAQLLDGINGTCSSSPPRILAGDDVSRYVANPNTRGRFPQISFDYVALALGGQTCYSGGDLYDTVLRLFPERCASNRSTYFTDDAPTAYDALSAIVAAVNMLQDTKITPGAVWHMITRITGDTRIDGASGIIDYGRDGSQVPLNKFLNIIHVPGVGAPQARASCGAFRQRVAASWCPS